MKPEDLAKSGSEAAHQTALFAWAALQLQRWPELRWLHHIPNGGSRGDTAQGRQIRGAQLKAQGVRTGVADLCLPVKRGAYSGLYIEMKKPAEAKQHLTRALAIAEKTAREWEAYPGFAEAHLSEMKAILDEEGATYAA